MTQKKPPPLLASLSSRFRSMSLRRKLIIIITGVSITVVALAMAATFLIELRFFRERLLQEYEATARLLAFNLETSVAFEDSKDANEMLSVLSQKPHVVTAATYLANGEILAGYRRDGSDIGSLKRFTEATNSIHGDLLVVSAPITNYGQSVGRIVLVAELDEIRSFLLSHFGAFAALLAGALVVSIILAAKLGRVLARPILDLADTAQRISRDQDYSTRHERVTDDETGHLVDAFNRMMAEIEHREAKLLDAKEKAEASSKAKDDFLSVISHELRTPLNPIIGYVEILLRANTSGVDTKQLKLIKQSAEHLQGIIDDILDYSRIERGVFAIAKEEVDHAEVCQEVLGLMLPEATRKGLGLFCSHSREGDSLPKPLAVISDRVRMRQILLNLASNAIKFTQVGAVNIRTHLVQTGEGRARLRFEVEDTGIGIAAEDRRKVFEPFSQIDGSLTRSYSGMGLGLAISRKIVGAMEGQIDFESEKDVGSRFWFEIPVEVVERSRAPDGNDTELHDAGRRRGRILLVDDQLVNRELAESLLTSCGQEVVCASNGIEALERAANETFSLIILDIKMPKMDGYETARRIRALEAERGVRTPIIAMTAHVTARGNRDSVDAGMDDFLAKPFNTAKLNVILEKWLS